MYRFRTFRFICRGYATKNSFFTNRAPKNSSREQISQLEWNLRTGRAVSLLKNSIPDFFDKGLVSSVAEDDESLYASHIQLCYTPPSHLPAPFPKTLRVEGLPMYHASAAFIQHTLKALYSDLDISLRTVRDQSSQARHRQLEMSVIISGKLRVTNKATEWDVKSTYYFSPLSGRIEKHAIDSIIPAPHQVVYNAFRSSILHIIGHERDARRAPCPVAPTKTEYKSS